MTSFRDLEAASENDRTVNPDPKSYHAIALHIVRCSLISHSSNRPLNRRALYLDLRATVPNLTTNVFRDHLLSATIYLREYFGMSLIELQPVTLPGNHLSPQRDECVLVSTLNTIRRLLNTVFSPAQQHESGIMLFVLTLIILKSDSVSYTDLRNSVILAKLHPFTELDTQADMLAEVDKWISRLLKTFLAQRVLETYRSKAPSGAAAVDGMQNEDVMYCIGPTARHLVNSRELFEIVLRIQFPDQDPSSESFQKSNEIVIKSLKQKFERTVLGSVP